MKRELIRALISEECKVIEQLLLAKNDAYHNSIFDPIRVFSKATVEEQIRTRLDDKLSRMARGAAAGEDTEADTIGYLILMRVWRKLMSDE